MPSIYNSILYWSLLTYIGLLLNSPTNATQAQQTAVYGLHRGGLNRGRAPFETELVALLLNESQERYGPAKLNFIDTPMSPTRTRKELQRGEIIHLQLGGVISKEFDARHSFKVRHPILNGLLGYRQLIVRNEMLEAFSSLDNAATLLKYSAGQATGWPDIDVLESNRINVVKSNDFASLFPMLKHKRFDYISLGTGEIQKSLFTQKQYRQHLTIVNNVVVYYPWPVYIFVSIHTPMLADRLEYSILKVRKSGKYDLLFKKHFSRIISGLNNKNTTTFVLKNDNYDGPDEFNNPVLLNNSKWVKVFK